MKRTGKIKNPEHKSKIDVRLGSEKNFGIVFAVVFAAIGLWPLVDGNDVRTWWLVAASAMLILAFAFPKVLEWPNKLWFKFGMLLGAVIAPIVMALVYITTVMPIGLILRVFGKDPLRRRIEPERASYWIERSDPPQSMKQQF